MKSITEMSQPEFRKFLDSLVNSEIFKSRERLAVLLLKNSRWINTANCFGIL